jgi:hypothetical protein
VTTRDPEVVATEAFVYKGTTVTMTIRADGVRVRVEGAQPWQVVETEIGGTTVPEAALVEMIHGALMQFAAKPAPTAPTNTVEVGKARAALLAEPA